MLSTEPNLEEIKKVMWALQGNKAPRPDGYNAHFFKETWHITGKLVLETNQEFFKTGELLRI